MMRQLETGNIGIGNTSTLATFNNDRFLIIDDKELYLIGASLKDLGSKCFHLRREAFTCAKATVDKLADRSTLRSSTPPTSAASRNRRFTPPRRTGCQPVLLHSAPKMPCPQVVDLCYTVSTQEITMDAAENQIVVCRPNETVRLDVWLETYELVANCDKSSCLLLKRIADVKVAA